MDDIDDEITKQSAGTTDDLPLVYWLNPL